MKKGFTLLEIMVVLIIIGILAVLGFTQYSRVIEKGRTAEGKANLGTIRTMAVAYYEENGAYPATTYLSTVLGLPTTTCAVGATTCACAATNTTYFYEYRIDAGVATCVRCTSNGKTPPQAAGVGYSLSITPGGVASSSPAGWW